MDNFLLPNSQKFDIFDLVITTLFDHGKGITFQQLHEIIKKQTEIAELTLLQFWVS